jgi:hypothetical protein
MSEEKKPGFFERPQGPGPFQTPLGPNAKTAFIITGVACGVLSILALIYIFLIPKPVLQKDIDKWKFAQLKNKTTGTTIELGENKCPTHGSYPVFVDVGLKDHKKGKDGKTNRHQKRTNREEFSEAIPIWNQYAKEEGAKSKLFEPYSEELVAKYRANPKNMETLRKWKEKGFPREWPIVVKVRPFSKNNYGLRKKCQLLLIDQTKFFPDMWAETQILPPKHKYLGSPVIRVCEETYNRGVGHNEFPMGVQDNKVAAKLRQFRLTGIGIHELGHVLFGTGNKSNSGWTPKGHAPSIVGKVMGKEPISHALSRHMRALLRQRVLKPCETNGLMFTPAR